MNPRGMVGAASLLPLKGTYQPLANTLPGKVARICQPARQQQDSSGSPTSCDRLRHFCEGKGISCILWLLYFV